MKDTDNIVKEKSIHFAIRIVNLYKYLYSTKKESVISKQILRSGTAIGALIHESEFAESKSDFIHKLSIALKEANETNYWLLILFKGAFIKESEYNNINYDIVELIKILTAIINTAKNNRK